MALSKGDDGVSVINLQKSLNQLGVAILKEDGIFGAETFAAVERFQSAHSLPVTGEVDGPTYNAIGVALTLQISTRAAPWLNWMRDHLGQIEQTGGPATSFDREVFSHTSYGDLDGVMEAGCAATACAALEESGYKSPHNAAAESFRNFGVDSVLTPGAVVGFNWRAEKGVHCDHVAFLDHIVGPDKIACIGGNQGHQVNVAVFSTKFIDFVRFPIERLDALPGKV
jgi:hypothetical protein